MQVWFISQNKNEGSAGFTSKAPAKAASNKFDKGPVNVLTPSVPDA